MSGTVSCLFSFFHDGVTCTTGTLCFDFSSFIRKSSRFHAGKFTSEEDGSALTSTFVGVGLVGTGGWKALPWSAELLTGAAIGLEEILGFDGTLGGPECFGLTGLN